MSSMNFDQQVDIFDPALARPVNVIGAGSVGSQVVETLACEGCTEITVWDYDIVASHNPPMSAYRYLDIMRSKVEALHEIVLEKTGIEINYLNKRYLGEPLKTATIVCVDEMDERILIWQEAKNNPFVEILIDTRTAIEYIEVFAIRPYNSADIEFYEHFLYPSNKALRPTCGTHGAKHISGTAANAAVDALTMWWKSHTVKRVLKQRCGHFQEIV